MRFQKGKLMYMEFMLRLFFRLLFLKRATLTANDLDTLLPCYLVSTAKGVPLIYDSHELFTEVPELIERPTTRKTWLKLEAFLFPKLKHVSVVSQSIADIYKDKYKVPVRVIRNVPNRIQTQVNVERENILLYQGALNVGRGIDLMIDTMTLLPEWQLWIAGGGDIERELQQRAEQSPAKDRIKFWGRIPHENLSQITCQARIGFSLEEDLGLNYRYAAPNKIFDCIQHHIPVIISNLPEMALLIKQTQTGIILKARNPQTLAQCVQLLNRDAKIYSYFVDNCERAAEYLCWEKESLHLLEMYEKANQT